MIIANPDIDFVLNEQHGEIIAEIISNLDDATTFQDLTVVANKIFQATAAIQSDYLSRVASEMPDEFLSKVAAMRGFKLVPQKSNPNTYSPRNFN